jgi:hypothetical protein
MRAVVGRHLYPTTTARSGPNASSPIDPATGAIVGLSAAVAHQLDWRSRAQFGSRDFDRDHGCRIDGNSR